MKNEKKINKLLTAADPNKKGVITFSKFVIIMEIIWNKIFLTVLLCSSGLLAQDQGKQSWIQNVNNVRQWRSAGSLQVT